MTFNGILWGFVNDAGWWFWTPFIGYSAYGLNKIYRLAPAETNIGRAARVVQTVGFLCMAFIPFFNGLGPYAFHLIASAACIILKQVYDNCLAAGKIKPPEAATAAGRMAERLTTVKT